MAAASARDRVRLLPRLPRRSSAGRRGLPRPVYAEKEGTSRIPTVASSACARRSGTPGESRARLVGARGAVRAARARAPARCRPRRSPRWWPRRCPSTPGSRSTRSAARACAGRTATPPPAAPERGACRATRSSSRRPPPEGLLLGAAPSLWTGPEVEHSPSLRFLDTGPRAGVSPADAARLGIASGDEVEVSADGDERQRHGRRPHRRAGGQRVPHRRRRRPRARRSVGAREAVAGLMVIALESTWVADRQVDRDLRLRARGSCRSSCWSSASCWAASSRGSARTGSAPAASSSRSADVLKLLSKEASTPETAVPWMMAIAPVISIVTAVATLAIIPLGPGGRLGRQPRPVRHRRLDRRPLLLRLRLARVLRADARRLGVGLEVLVPRRDALGRPADLLRGGARPGAARRGDDGRLAVARGHRRARRTTSGTSSRSSWASASSSWPASPRPPAPPFDLPEADAEIVAGYNTEFGGMRFGSFFMAEYIEVVIISGIAAACFLGGWHGPGPIALGAALDAHEADAGRDLLHLDPRLAAAPALRPADVVRLEGPAAAGHAQRPRNRDRHWW